MLILYNFVELQTAIIFKAMSLLCCCRQSIRSLSVANVPAFGRSYAVNANAADIPALIAVTGGSKRPARSPLFRTPKLNAGHEEPYLDVIPASESVKERSASPEDELRELDNKWQSASQLSPFYHDRRPPNQFSARTQQISGSTDFASAWRAVHAVLSQSDIRREARMRERHEKPTAERHRKRSERHRRRFKAEVSEQLKHVMRMKRKGL